LSTCDRLKKIQGKKQRQREKEQKEKEARLAEKGGGTLRHCEIQSVMLYRVKTH